MTKTKILLSVSGMETGNDPSTGEQKYQVHFAPAVMSKKDYEEFIKRQISSSDDVVEVFLE